MATRQGRRTRRGGARDAGMPTTPDPGSTPRRTRRRNPPATATATADDQDVPRIYQDMLSEVQSSAAGTALRPESGRSAKRRRVGERPVGTTVLVPDDALRGSEEEVAAAVKSDKPVQTVYDIDASDESGMEWEDVELEPSGAVSALESKQPTSFHTDADAGEEPLRITLGEQVDKGKQKATSALRRKPVTGMEKKRRLDIHKVHLLCLLSHVQLRNSWCNDTDIQSALKRVLSKHIILCLNPNPALPQFTRSTTFADGLKQAAEAFRRIYKVTSPGMRRPYWIENLEAVNTETVLPEGAEILQSKDDFRTHATALQGSRDLGAQLFCAMLRGVGVECRLVSSLQPLPFSGVAKGESPRKPEKEYIVLSEAEGGSSSPNTSSSTPVRQATPARRLGKPQFLKRPASTAMSGLKLGRQPAISDSPFPVFWVEAFNEAMQKWVTVDPLVTNTIGKPTRLEPPLADRLNNMSYVIAFEDDLSARDVTRRYVKSFNSKTRKMRVESTKGGEEWWSATMEFFERPFLEDRDQLEFGELTSKAAAEGMPRNVQDFKDHPIYALERHLRRNEVIHPKREIGKVGLSKSTLGKKDQPLEPVYRRADVHTVRSAEGWYRQGRSVKPGEQPLKRVPTAAHKVPASRGAFDDDEDGDEYLTQDTPMYAEFQTELCKPPPVVNGRVPRNAYGNIDVYAQNMIPEGGFHLKHPDAAMAAKILRIDYADAVTGFSFKGRHGTAVVQGIVAAVEYREALLAVLSGLEDEHAQAEQERRTLAALRMWRTMLIKLRVVERIKGYKIEGDNEDADENVGGDEPMEDSAEDGGGGFIPEDNQRDQGPTSRSNLSPDPRSPASVEEDTPMTEAEEPGHHDAHVPAIPGPARPSLSQPVVNRGPSLRSLNPKPATPRYKLVVVPKGANSPEPKADVPQPPPKPPFKDLASESAPISISSTPSVTPGPTTNADVGASSSAPLVVNSPSAAPSVSVGEHHGLPELVHSESASEDGGSMLSHDPEDDDLEPDWLLSD